MRAVKYAVDRTTLVYQVMKVVSSEGDKELTCTLQKSESLPFSQKDDAEDWINNVAGAGDYVIVHVIRKI
jgi:hypothetical protein